jgi:uncharacterized membrane protein YcaP (DUF421 family)
MMLDDLNLWTGWLRLIEVVLSAVLFYVFIIALVRLLGKRTTSQFNNFDWIINVAVGSLAASGILLKDVATIDALAAIVALAMCQFLATWWVNQTDLGSRVVKAEPVLLTHRGELLTGAMDAARVSEEEILAALRRQGLVSKDEAEWVILETNGELTVIPRQDRERPVAEQLEGVQIPHRLRSN